MFALLFHQCLRCMTLLKLVDNKLCIWGSKKDLLSMNLRTLHPTGA